MTHFGIICPPFPGHLHPLSALGRELQGRGHRVTVLQIPDLELKVRSEGLDFWTIGETLYEPGLLAATFKQLGKLSKIDALHYSLDLCQKLTTIICEDAPKAIQAAGIDVLLVDQLEPAGETVSEYLNMPMIGICNAQAIHRRADVPPFFMPWSYHNAVWAKLRNQVAYYFLDRNSQPILETLNHYRHQWKLPTYRHLYSMDAPRLAQISQQPAAFDFPSANVPEHFHYVGPLRNPSPSQVPFPFEQLTGQPLIYASLGSVQNTKHNLFHQIAAACKNLDVQLVITHGRSMSDEAAQSLPGSPLVVEYAPQGDVIARASLTITHAGLNTVLDSLSYGVPLVAIPITFEQPGTGARIQWTATGEVISFDRLTVPELRSKIQRVMTEESYRFQAAKIQQAIRQAGGVTRAADVIEQAIKPTYLPSPLPSFR